MPHHFTSRDIPKRTKSENLKKYLLLVLLVTGAKKGEATQMSNRPTDKRTVWSVYIMEGYSALKRKEMPTRALRGMNLEDMRLGE